MPRKLPHYLLTCLCLLSLLLLSPERAVAGDIVVTVEDPQLFPPFTTCPDSFWYPFANNRGHTAYLTLNVSDPADSTNHGEWHPVIPQTGYYRVEAYIAAHSPIVWCNQAGSPIAHDTTDARYTIYHARGVTNRPLSQYPLSNQWLDLGEYYFTAGQSGYVTLKDLNGEAEFSTTVSFSAMRFTFTRLTRPTIYLPLVLHKDPSGQIPPDTGIIRDQGFDACHLPEISEMQTWWNSSPYSFYALYLGGISLYHECSVASAAWVNAVHQQGWSFVPTWVGPQAPCSQWAHKMSSNPAVSYQEGRAEAQAASIAAAAMGLTNNGLGGTIIYYDMEAYGIYTPECRLPVAAFINGWVQRLHELGNLAGAYGTRNSYPADWAAISNVPDDLWPASWYTNVYDPYASVYGIDWIEGLWINHQRIRQYAGEVGNTWGGISMNIDIDVADGMVAMPPTNPLAAPVVTTTTPEVQDTGWLTPDQGWLVSDGQLYWTEDRGDSWQERSPASVQVAWFLPSGHAWAYSIDDEDIASLYHSANWGIAWERRDVTLPQGSWRPLQLQFTSPNSGWIVLQKQTSQAFDAGILLKTNDSGLTWQVSDLPTASPLQFTTTMDAWVTSRISGKAYLTLDGGLTWQPAGPGQSIPSQSALPQGTQIAGWMPGGLGWAVTSTGSCRGEKSAPGFTCQQEHTLWQTLDGGSTWHIIPLLSLLSNNP